MSEFHIDATIQSQYSASKHICNLVNAFWESINPEADIELIYNKMINPLTAEGIGLDVWGRIVAAGRTFLAKDESLPYFGFDPVKLKNERVADFNHAPFYTEVNGQLRLSDEAYRTYIFVKAMINIGKSSLADLNKMLHTMFPKADIQILHISTMTLRLLMRSNVASADIAALLNLPWLPTGVGLEFYQVITPTFGFKGSNLKNFGNSTFSTYSREDIA